MREAAVLAVANLHFRNVNLQVLKEAYALSCCAKYLGRSLKKKHPQFENMFKSYVCPKSKIYQHLQHPISLIRFIVQYILILYVFHVVDIIVFYIHGQTSRTILKL